MKILVPIDAAFPHSDIAGHVGWLLPVEGAQVTLLYVNDSSPAYVASIYPPPDFPDDWAQQVEYKAKLVLRPYEQQFREVGAQVSLQIATGNPEHVIAQVAEEQAADFVVVSPGKHSTIERFLMGSTSSKVVRLSPGSIIVLRDHKGHERLEHVLFGIDGSKQSLLALRTAAANLRLKQSDTKITLLHVVSLPPVVSMMSPAGVLVAVEKNLEIEGEAVLAEALKNLKDIGISNAELKLTAGDAAAELIRTAEQANAQLIVIGAQGHSAVEYLLMGSVADRVVNHAKCSVAIVKTPKS